ncbi:MAG: hypothetical protein HC828_21985 [Blastochloris sp.]|nr:hypothetical protein [Blastochloris sp.]
MLIPILAIGVQPLVNLLVTGSAVATGNAAKSLFGVVPFDLGYVISRILETSRACWPNWSRCASRRISPFTKGWRSPR